MGYDIVAIACFLCIKLAKEARMTQGPESKQLTPMEAQDAFRQELLGQGPEIPFKDVWKITDRVFERSGIGFGPGVDEVELLLDG